LNKIYKYINDFSELVAFKHSVFSLPFIFIAMLVASNGWFGWSLLFLGLFAAISARNFAMGVNRYLDRDVDILNPRTKNRPSVDGRVGHLSMIIFIALNAILFIAVSYLINPLALKLSIPFLIIIGAYTLFKRFSSLAHIILGISLGLAPIAGAVAVLGYTPIWSLYLAIAVTLWVAGFDLLYSLQDIEFDKAHNLHSIPSKFGASKTMKIALLFHMLTVAFFAIFVNSASLHIYAYIAVIISAIMLSYEHYLVHKDFTKIDKAFFTVNGYLGFMFLFMTVLDISTH